MAGKENGKKMMNKKERAGPSKGNIEPWKEPRPCWDPMLAIETIRDTMNELMADIFYQSTKPPFDVPWQPDIDMFSDEFTLYVNVNLAGARKDDIQIHSTSELLIIHGEITPEEDSAGMRYYVQEMKCGRFARSIPLPFRVVPSGIKANFSEGMLKITLPIESEKSSGRVKVDVE